MSIKESIKAKTDVDLSEFTEEGQVRKLQNTAGKMVTIIGIIWSAFHLYTIGAGMLTATLQRSAHLSVGVALCFLYFPLNRKDQAGYEKLPFRDILLALAGFVSIFYIFNQYEELVTRIGQPTTLDIIMGVITILVILETARRAFGWVLPGVTVVFIAYAFLGPYLFEGLAHRGYALRRVVDHLYLTGEGIFGIPVGVSASFVFGFVLFGAFFQEVGAGLYLVKLSYATLGRFRGGPAKAAVLASGFLGSIVGSSVANTAITGSLTIPVMKKCGFKPEVAGAVETAASTNGQFLPPVMGAAAFIMAEFTGIPYVQIIFAAALPAVISYVAILSIVHLEAAKTGMKPMPKDEIPPFWATFLEGIQYWIPLIILVYYLIIIRVTPLTAAYYAILAIIALSVITKAIATYKEYCTGTSPGECIVNQVKSLGMLFFKSLDSAAKGMAGIAVACACAGIIVGIVTLTGLGMRMTMYISVLASNNLLVLLIMAAGMSIILGMGLPTTAKYVVMATLVAPAILFVEPTLPVVAVHLFIIYYAILADDTPPVGVAAYAAAAIARSDPIKTGFLGFKFDLAAFLLPFMFIYNPSLLLIDTTWYKAILIAATSVFGMYCFAAVIQRWLFTRLKIWEQAILLVIAVSMVWPNVYSDIAGLVIFSLIYFNQRARKAREDKLNISYVEA
ncbi:MAG: TRAP transporter permease [Bacillota bacterium]|nr:TRAP transporter permease [Bacillota bacterium]MDW7684780.1 TRAP transporter permease [Bacillota bacterium]